MISEDIFENIETDEKKLQKLEYYDHYCERVQDHIERHEKEQRQKRGYISYDIALCERVTWTIARFPSYSFQKQKDILALYVNEFKKDNTTTVLMLDFDIKVADVRDSVTFPLNALSIKVLGSILSVNNSIINLYIDGNRWNETTMSILCKYLTKNESLKKLSLSNLSIGALQILGHFLKDNSKIKNLWISDTHIDPIYFETFYESLQENKSLEALNLIDNNLNRNTNFKLNFWSNDPSVEAMKSLAEFIKKSPSLKELNFGEAVSFNISHFKALLAGIKWSRSFQNLGMIVDDHSFFPFTTSKEKFIKILKTNVTEKEFILISNTKTIFNFVEYNENPKDFSLTRLDLLIRLLNRNKLLFDLDHTNNEKRAIFVFGLYEHHCKSYKIKENETKPLQAFSGNKIFSKDTVKLIFFFAGFSENPGKNMDIIQKNKKEIPELRIAENISISSSADKNSEDEFQAYIKGQALALEQFNMDLKNGNHIKYEN